MSNPILFHFLFQEKMCEESASFDLTSFDIASCIEVVGQLLERTTEVNTLNEQFNGVEGNPSFIIIIHNHGR